MERVGPEKKIKEKQVIMHCPKCGKKLHVKFVNETMNADNTKWYQRKTYWCEDDDVWLSSEVPIKKKKTKQITVIVGIVIKDNKLLMVQRDEEECPDAHLKWELPGGKVDFGETPEESLKREFLEETGVEIKVKKLIPHIFTHNWKYSWGIQQTLIFVYICSYVRTINKKIKDHHVKKIKWIRLEDLKKTDTIAGMDEIMKEANKLLF